MLLAALAETSDAVAATRSRLAKIELLVACLRALDADERETAVAWLAGALPGGRLGLGPATVHDLRGVPPAAEATLAISAARERLESVAGVRGAGSATRRRAILESLFAAATAREQSFLARLLVGELRQGALEGVMADAIAAAAGLPAPDVRRAIMLAGAIAPVAVAALAEGAAGLERFKLKLFEPVSPMLASPTQDVESALAELGLAAFEHKLDGARVQVHKQERDVKIYSRTGRDVTFSLPEIEAAIAALDASQLDPRRRGDRARCGGPPAAVPRDDAPLRTQARDRGHARFGSAVVVLLRLFARGRRGSDRSPDRGARRGARPTRAGEPGRAAHRDRGA